MVMHSTTGLAAAVMRPGRPSADVVRRMLARLSHRGPDLSALSRRIAGSCEMVLGHVGMVANPDDLAGWRPPPDPGAGSALAVDGFFTSLDALTARLRGEGAVDAEASPACVIGLALSQWGGAVLGSLDGHFAIVHYDAVRGRLLLARDALGVKPLYWAHGRGGEGLIVASEIRAVLASGLVDADYDAAGIASYLAYGHSHAPRTIHRHVHAVPPGCWLEIRLDGDRFQPTTSTPFWRPPAVRPPLDPNAGIEGVRSALAGSIATLSAGLPTASTYLPGDIKSAVLAVLASRCLSEIRTAFVDLDTEGHEERARLAAAVAEELRARHFQMIVDDEWGADLWMDWLSAADAPCIDGYDAYVVSQAIKDTGAVAALFPAGGAELIRGNPWFAMTSRLTEIAGLVKRVPRWLRSSVLERISRASSPLHRDMVHDACVDDASPVTMALHARRVFHSADLGRLRLDSTATGLGHTALPVEAQAALPTATGDLFADLMRLHCASTLPNRTLLACDNGSMANSLEVRLPYATRQVVESLLVMPGSLISPKPSRSGALIRSVAGGMLPYNLLVRHEPRPQFHFTAWMHGSQKRFTEQCIAAVASCPVLDGDAVWRTWHHIVNDSRGGNAGKALTLVALGAAMRRAAWELPT